MRSTSRLIITLRLLLFLALAPTVWGEEWIMEPPFMPFIPEVMGQGGAVIAIPDGYRALFLNPAGFAHEEVNFYPLSGSMWYYAQPFRFFPDRLTADDQADILKAFETEMHSGGFGAGFSGTIAYVGKGLGLGAMFVADAFASGKDAPSVTGDAHATFCLIGGYAFSFPFFGADISIGGAFKPMFRFHSALPNANALRFVQGFAQGENIFAALNGTELHYGMGIGVDLGLLTTIGPFRWGLTLYDVGGSYFFYRKSPFEGAVDSLQRGHGLPDGSPTANLYRIPMNVSTGIALVPHMGKISKTFQPSFHLDADNIVGIIRDKRSPWILFHLGTEFRLFDALTLRAGINQGHFTFGGGFQCYFLNLNFAYYTRELGQFVGDRPSTGCSFQADLKF